MKNADFIELVDEKATNELETGADPGVPVGDGVPAVEGDGLGRAPRQQLQEAQLVAVRLVVDVVRTVLFLAQPTLGRKTCSVVV